MDELDRIVETGHGKIFASSSIYETIKDLCLLGSRFAGTISEKEAQEYMKNYIKGLGIEPIEYEFEYMGWYRGTCIFFLQTEETKPFPAFSLVYSPSTEDEGFVGKIVDGGGGSETELKRIQEEVKGSIVMIHSGQTEEGWLHRRIKYANAVEFGAKAFLFANHNPGQLFPTGSVRSNRMGEIPAIGISKETYEYIKEQIRRKEEVNGKIYVLNHASKTTSKHIIWEIEGEEKEEVIVIGGHYDGHDLAQGATDNAGSVAALLELTKLMKEINYVPKRTIRFIAFGVEEFGVVGSTIYVNSTDVSDVVAMINVDGLVGHIPKILACGGYDEMIHLAKNIRNKLLYDPIIQKAIITASDNYPFLLKGIPNVCIYSQNPDPKSGRGYGHTSADTFDKITKLDAKLALGFIFSF
ncbi:MAG: M20/M25/M40 family metallo-hydrolase, partial [Candidatus Heimdallarchaeota archaeon]|nr:M20/M25/M40 family metallo-hydrolase [Candidatus Heimdallarchaeota archaeon]